MRRILLAHRGGGLGVVGGRYQRPLARDIARGLWRIAAARCDVSWPAAACAALPLEAASAERRPFVSFSQDPSA